ncbi:MAG: hypothetical protein PHE77_01660 [Candidatus Pacebacteria bacterium]|nr:hypothetical protein [Candidatus Paceibacterota bacterium]
MEGFNHTALGLQKERPLVYTAMSKHLFYFRFFISQFVVKQGAVPLNPFLLWDYFLLDIVDRNQVREANNNIVKRADEVWVFGPVSNGVLAEIKIAQEQKKPVKFFKIEKPHKIVPVVSKEEIEMEDDVKDFKNEINFNKKKVVICGSVKFAKELVEIYHKLEGLGLEPIMHEEMFGIADGTAQDLIQGIAENHAGVKQKYDFIKYWHNLIVKSDAILVCNFDKNGIQNYIGGNTLMEIGFAFVNDKKIFLLNDIPEISYKDEIIAMQPIVLNGDLGKLEII